MDFMLRYKLTVLLFLIGSIASAQVVNIEKNRKDHKNKKIQGFVDLSLNYSQNNTELFQAKNKVQLQYFRGKSTYLAFNELSQVSADKKSYLNDGFVHLRYNYDFKPRFLIGEIFTQYQYNRIKKIKHRYLAGGGPRLRMLDTTNVNIFLGPLIMYEYEMLTDENVAVSEKLRLSLYASVRYKINKVMDFSHITYYQPWVSSFKNVRIASETVLGFIITKKLSLKIIYNLAYDSRPPSEVNDLFYSISNGLSYKF